MSFHKEIRSWNESHFSVVLLYVVEQEKKKSLFFSSRNWCRHPFRWYCTSWYRVWVGCYKFCEDTIL